MSVTHSLTANQTIILEKVFNTKVLALLPLPLPPRPRLDKTKYYRYHHNYSHNTKDRWALKDKIEELIQTKGHQEDQHRNHDVEKRRDKANDRGRQRHH